MAVFRCYRCRVRQTKWHEWEGDKPLCPRCGAGVPAVVELVAVHFLYGDPRGPIEGVHGIRYKVACEPGREVLALHIGDDYAASGDPRAVTCPSCMGTEAYKRGAMLIKELRQMMIAAGPGCCG